jgi:hypothetical protein
MLLSAFLILATSQEVAAIDLYRGAPLANQAIGYWDVSDTYLDSRFPDRNFGGDGVLLGGAGKTILIRFGDLPRVLGANRVRKATLQLTTSGGEVPALKSVGRLKEGWGEGPLMTLGALLERNMKERAKKEPEPEIPPAWSATWKARRAGTSPLNWQQPGASGTSDTIPISSAKLEKTDDGIQITGIEAAVQAMLDRPFENRGLALTFTNNAEFFSSQASANRPRLVVEMEAVPAKSGPDLSVTSIERVGSGGALPKAGEEATYIAHVKNLGNEASKGFATTWSLNEGGGPVQDAPGLPPGGEATFKVSKAFRWDSTDHRMQPILFTIVPSGPDALPQNNGLEVQENSRALEVVAQPGSEDAVQRQVDFFNEVLAPFSRYSFAREGALERVSVQRVASSPTNGPADGRLTWSGAIDGGVDLNFQRALGQAVGLPNLASTQYLPGDRNTLVNRGSMDMAPGIMGYGDTRYDGALLGSITLLHEPYWTALGEVQGIEATGLLSMTDVAILNQGLGRTTTAEMVLTRVPDVVLLRAMDLAGRPLANLELSFFQSTAGKFQEDPPAFSVVTDTRGTAILPKRPDGLFGKVAPDGSNGVFLVSATVNGVTEWGWLKNWQLVDALNRGGPGAAIFDMRFNLPGSPLDRGSDLASERIVTDNAGSPSAALSALLDGSGKAVPLGGKKGDWIEIDLGRDRSTAEIDILAGPSEMWRKFDIMVYGTGQTVSEANYWVREQDWTWTAANRRDLVGQRPSVAYRGQPVRVRYIRIVNRGDGAGTISGVRVIPAKL